MRKLETVADLILGGSKITADGDCSHEIKRCLILGRKVMTNPDSILKSRDITLPTKVRLVKAGFSSGHVWMWELDCEEGWVQKNWCFWTVVLEKTLESLGCSLEGLILKLKLQYFGPLMQRADSFENTLMLGKIEGRRRRGRQKMRWWMASPNQWTWVRVDSGSWWWKGRPGVLQFMGSQRVGRNWTTELNWNLLWNGYKASLRMIILIKPVRNAKKNILEGKYRWQVVCVCI